MIDPGSFEFSPINCRKPQSSSSMYLCMYVSGAGVKMSEEALCLVKIDSIDNDSRSQDRCRATHDCMTTGDGAIIMIDLLPGQ